MSASTQLAAGFVTAREFLVPSSPTTRPLHFNTAPTMSLSRLFSPSRPANLARPVANLRPRLRDLHAFGLVSVYRRPSFFRLWEPLRGDPARDFDFQG